MDIYNNDDTDIIGLKQSKEKCKKRINDMKIKNIEEKEDIFNSIFMKCTIGCILGYSAYNIRKISEFSEKYTSKGIKNYDYMRKLHLRNIGCIFGVSMLSYLLGRSETRTRFLNIFETNIKIREKILQEEISKSESVSHKINMFNLTPIEIYADTYIDIFKEDNPEFFENVK